ncbi:MAG: PilZ domain-containing protein, partial [Nitrospirae bacterium]
MPPFFLWAREVRLNEKERHRRFESWSGSHFSPCYVRLTVVRKVRSITLLGRQGLMDRRATSRLLVHFHTTLSKEQGVIEGGTLIDLSMEGCRVESDARLTPGNALSLRLFISGGEPPIEVERAEVRWVKGLVSGVAFITIKEKEQERLRQVIRDLEG